MYEETRSYTSIGIHGVQETCQNERIYGKNNVKDTEWIRKDKEKSSIIPGGEEDIDYSILHNSLNPLGYGTICA